MLKSGNGLIPGMDTYVFSKTLPQQNLPDVKLVSLRHEEKVNRLRSNPGKDIWLFGGGSLFRSLAEARLVDTVEVSLIPVLLGRGVPLLPSPASRINLKLNSQKVYKSGIVSLEYSVV